MINKNICRNKECNLRSFGWRLHFCLLLSFLSITLSAQEVAIKRSAVRTVTMLVNHAPVGYPILTKGHGDVLHIDFDMLDPVHRRITYELSYLTPTFKPEESVFPEEAVSQTGTLEVLESLASETSHPMYTHYRIAMPNDVCRPLLSGNYRLTFFLDEDTDEIEEGEELFSICFSVVEPQCKIEMRVTGNTDIDTYERHQQVEVTAHFEKDYFLPSDEIRLSVVQNDDWHHSVMDLRPKVCHSDVVEWYRQRPLIFPGGNEYKSFELYSSQYPGRGIETVRYDATKDIYRAYLLRDEPRKNYLFVRDKDGLYFSPQSLHEGGDYQGEYYEVTFRLHMPYNAETTIYVDGDFTHHERTEQYAMTYDEAASEYRLTLLLKAGYYNYRYVEIPDDGATVDNNFYQTENSYTAFIFKRRPVFRHWQLVGVSKVETTATEE